MKKKEKIMSYLAMEYKQMELYFEDMAKKGWLLKDYEELFFKQVNNAVFMQSEPKTVQYCVDFKSNDSYDYFETCRLSGWNYVASTSYFHIFMHEGEPIVPLQSDERIESQLIYDQVYRKELRKFYRGVFIFIFIMYPGIERLLNPAIYENPGYTITHLSDLMMLGMTLLYFLYSVVMIETIRHMMKKRTFLKRSRHPLSRFLGIYPFTVAMTIFIIYDIINNLQQGKAPLDPFVLIIAILISLCYSGIYAIRKKGERIGESSVSDK